MSIGNLLAQPIADGKEKWLGNIHSFSQTERFTEFWNQVTPENSGKWGSVEGSRDQMNWNNLDDAYNMAKNNGFPFRFHVLIWGNQQPNWIAELPAEEQREEIEEWFTAVAERYPDIDYLEVVNEPLHDPPNDPEDGGYINALGGLGRTGYDWVITAFELAREIFPDSVKLMINDYNIVNSSGSVTNYLRLVNLLKDRGLIDIIGVQAHAFSTGGSGSGTTPATLKNSLDELGESGLPIQVTEMDIDGDPDADDDESQEIQLERYQRIFPVFWEHPKVMGITLWGWRVGLWRSDQDAYIFYNGRPREAMDWLIEYVDTANVEVNVSNEEFTSFTPDEFELNQNYPNPFNPSTKISYSIPEASEVQIRVYDVTGRLIRTLVNAQQAAGNHTVLFEATNLPTGVYIYEINAGAFRQVRKMTLIK